MAHIEPSGKWRNKLESKIRKENKLRKLWRLHIAKEESGGKFLHLDNSVDKGEKEENPNKRRRKKK